MNSTKIMIVSGGTVDDELLMRSLADGDYSHIFGVDKGLEALFRLGIRPDKAIGDFDSATDSIREMYIDSPDAIILKPEKDYTDTHIALIEALKLQPDRIDIIGATGSRLDHVLGNFALLKLCVMHGVSAFILDTNNRITMIDREITVTKSCSFGKYVSLIPFSDKVTGINTRGFKYELSDAVLVKEETIGISNELREEEGRISIEDGYLLVLWTKD